MLERYLQRFAVLILAVLLAACGTDTSSSSGSSAAAGDGDMGGPSFSLRLTDAPFDDAVRVDITFVEVRLRKVSGGWVSIPVNPAQKIELAQLQGTRTAELLLDIDVEPGDYNQLRLIVDTAPMANTIQLSAGGVFNLKIPSGDSTGLKIKGKFTVSDTRPTSMVVDVDLRRSIRKAGSNFTMKPVLRMVKGGNFGHIRGRVDPALLVAPGCSDAQVDTFNAVYVYAGHNARPTDINQASKPATGPITTSKIAYDASSTNYIYEAAFLPAGKYTIAFTCNSDLDDLNATDNLQFFGIQNVKVRVKNTIFL